MPAPPRELPFADNGSPPPAAWRWAAALAAVAAGFLSLILGERVVGQWPAVLLFVGLPLLGLYVLTKGGLGLVFKRPTARDWITGLAFGGLNLVAAPVLGWLVIQLLPTAPNPVNAVLAQLTPGQLPGFFAMTGLQLVDEELVTVIPFLAVMVAGRRLGLSRRASVIAGALGAAALFAAMHFPTYQWHVLQALALIGGARLILFAAYLRTRNLWASVIAHIFNDWTLFGIVLLASRAAG